MVKQKWYLVHGIQYQVSAFFQFLNALMVKKKSLNSGKSQLNSTKIQLIGTDF